MFLNISFNTAFTEVTELSLKLSVYLELSLA